MLAGVIVIGSIAAYIWWKRRRREGTAPLADEEKLRVDKNGAIATALYRALEHALALQGLGRPPSLPPLRHAEELRAKDHPLADDILALTDTYLSARFGGQAIDEPTRRDFEKKVRAIRVYQPAKAAD